MPGGRVFWTGGGDGGRKGRGGSFLLSGGGERVAFESLWRCREVAAAASVIFRRGVVVSSVLVFVTFVPV